MLRHTCPNVSLFQLRLRLWLIIFLLSLPVLFVLGRYHIQAFVMMSCITWPESRLRALEQDVYDADYPNGAIPGRLYMPVKYSKTSLGSAPRIVLIHGVHRLGIDDPRLNNAARSIAGLGIIVYAPQIPDLTEYKITPPSIEVMGSAIKRLAQPPGQSAQPVGVMSLSFAGGLALMAAADPQYAKHIKFVWVVGAHHDMARIGRFFATNEAPRPDGSTLKMPAHEYGALVLIYSHLEDFFSDADIPAAHDAIRLLLREEWNVSHEAAAKLSPAGQELMRKLYDKDRASLREPLLASIAKHQAEYDAVSPRFVLKNIRVPVLLLHGAGDDVIPPSETEWLTRDIPAQYVHESLITPAISHVGTGNKPSFPDKIRLMNVMTHLLRESEGH